jgi:flagellar hook assembly protein FlgD
MKARTAFLSVFAVLTLAAAAFSQTAVNPSNWVAANSMTLQTSGKTLLFEMKDVSQSVRLSIVDLKGNIVWSRTLVPANGAVSVSWRGAADNGQSLARGSYVFRAASLQGRKETPLMARAFARS